MKRIKVESLGNVYNNTNKLKNKGITLIALVVTIVVLLILAGVSISLVLGQNGLITQAQEAKRKTAEAEKNETTSIDSTSDWVSEIVNNTSLPQNNITKPYMPSSEFRKVEGTNLANGLVIEDASGNQYVWVEVPMTAEVYPTAGLEIIEFNADIYTKIENDLHNYADLYTTSWKDEYCELNSDGWFKNIEEYNERKYKILKSIYENGGFWIGRYEAGTEINRIEGAEINVKPQSKENLYPYTFVTRSQSKKIAEMIEYENGEKKYSGSLMLGIQWDLMLKYIETKQNETEEIIKELTSDSTKIGNYYNSTYKLNRGKYAKLNNTAKWYNYTDELDGIVENSIKSTQDTFENAILLTTGASDQNKLMNIFDIAGNVREWTLEYTLDNEYPCVYRGADCGDLGYTYSVRYRFKAPDYSASNV